MHVDDEVVCDVMDGQLFSVPPNEPFEFESNFLGRKFIEHKHFHGVVEVKAVKTRRGLELQLEEAAERSATLLAEKDKEMIEGYVYTQQEDRLGHGRPALPPRGRHAKLLAKYKTDLRAYGIRPVGTSEAADTQLSPEVKAILEQNQQLISMMAQILGAQGIKPPALKQSVEVPVVVSETGKLKAITPVKNITVAPSKLVEDESESTTLREGDEIDNEGVLVTEEVKRMLADMESGDPNNPDEVPGPVLAGAAKEPLSSDAIGRVLGATEIGGKKKGGK
jgi:hypothetical protein